MSSIEEREDEDRAAAGVVWRRLTWLEHVREQALADPRSDDIAAMLAQGTSVREVADSLNLPQATLLLWRRALGLPVRVVVPPVRARGFALLRAGVTVSEVAKRLGMRLGVVQGWLVDFCVELTPEELHRRERTAERMLRSGSNNAEVMDEMGLCSENIHYLRKGIGDSLPRSRRRAYRRLRALLKAGRSCAEIAKELGMARQTVERWSHGRGVPLKLIWDPRTPDVERLLQAGLRAQTIASRTGMPLHRVLLRRRLMGLPNPPRRHRQRDRAEALLRAGTAVLEVARLTGVTAQTIRVWRRALEGETLH